MAIALLTSGATLGTHVPALILANRLRRAGAEVRVEVFERLLPPDELQKLRKAKPAFRANYKMAVTAQRMVRDQTPALDEHAVLALLDRWQAERVEILVAFSGFWVPVIERYEAMVPGPLDVDICHLDSAPTASFRLFEDRCGHYRRVWMFDAENDRIPMSIPVTDEAPLPWADREPRVLAHGGGWGLGTYRDRAAELVAHGIDVDIVAHAETDYEGAQEHRRIFLIDPAWEAWTDGGFPPFGQLPASGPTEYRRGTEHHDSFDLARRSLAMMCKTGGGTLIDSLWSATPIVLLEPFGAHEQINARMWERLGYGIGYDAWRATGFSVPSLEKLHSNLLAARAGVTDYTTDLLLRHGTEPS